MAKNNRVWHKNFIKYTKYITKHPNYKGLLFKLSKDKNIKWVVTGKSENGKKRRDWWNIKCKENKIKIEPGCYAKIAALIHPTKKHVCQICGRSLSVKYIYPNKRMLNQIEKKFNVEYEPFIKDIFEIIKELVKNKDDILKFVKIFRINKKSKIFTKSNLLEYIKKELVNKSAKRFLSPGVMSNSPDRFDGFHSDGNCCRPESDKGRHKSNLLRYGQDRRVYMNWADGNWKKADRLMSEFSRHGVSADHIGPISLGFCHRPKFQPMTREQNSTKNNRMSLQDVKILIDDEKNGEQIVSWHSKYIWDKLKKDVNTNTDAIKLSRMMRSNLHHVLMVFSIIEENGHIDFLKSFLHPEYSFFDYRFYDFNKKDGTYGSCKKIVKKGKNQKNNAGRYFRIAFEELKQYRNIKNRNIKKWKSRKTDELLKVVLHFLDIKEYKKAKKCLDEVFIQLAKDSSKDF